MAEAVASLSLAINIVQLIQFTGELVGKAREIHSSAQSSSINNSQLEVIASGLDNLVHELRPASVRPRSSLSNIDRELQDVCDGCRASSLELQIAISSLKKNGQNKVWNSFRQALAEIWNEDKIKDLEERMERYRRQLDSAMLVFMMQSIQKLSESGRNGNANHLLDPAAPDWMKELFNGIRNDQKEWQEQNERHIAKISSVISAGSEMERQERVKADILKMLGFDSKEHRFDRIPKAHEQTFDWLFQDDDNQILARLAELRQDIDVSKDNSEEESEGGETTGALRPRAVLTKWSNFGKWLQSDENLYWITGKPGSGKSTLMKYLHTNQWTSKRLNIWSKDTAVAVGAYFFWNSGTTLQQTETGMLRSLLYDVLSKDHELVPQVFPSRWESHLKFHGDLRPWTIQELLRAFEILVSDPTRKYFFLIDGLDELSGDEGEPGRLAAFIVETASAAPNIKLCVSSRPSLILEEAFEGIPSLTLEDLTAPDIHLYVAETLYGNPFYRSLQERDQDKAKGLVLEITDKAQGVFLWVRLVVQSLLQGLRNGDKLETLQRRLLELPVLLENLFRTMLSKLHDFYFEQAAVLFQIVRYASQPLTLLELSFAEDGLLKALESGIGTMTVKEESDIVEDMRRRLATSSMGLLEAPLYGTTIFKAKVQYLHRTVRDFLYKEDTLNFLTRGTEQQFDPQEALCGAYLRRIKATEHTTKLQQSFWKPFNLSVKHAIAFEKTKTFLHLNVLTTLEKVGDHVFGRKLPGGQTYLEQIIAKKSHWFGSDGARHWSRTDTSEHLIDPKHRTCFLDFAFGMSLQTYILRQVSDGKSVNSTTVAGQSMLKSAVLLKDAEFCRALLQRGADLNAREPSQSAWTVWESILAEYEGEGKETPESRDCTQPWTQFWYEVLTMCLEAKADPHAKLGAISAENIIRARRTENNQEHWPSIDEVLRKLNVAKSLSGHKPRNRYFRPSVLLKRLKQR